MQQPLYMDKSKDKVDTTVASTLYQRHAASIFTYLRLHMPSREDAEDLLVDTFLAALESKTFHTLSQEQQRLWLWRVAHNKVVDRHRSSKHRPMFTLDDIAEDVFYDEEQAPDMLAERSEEYLRLYRHVKELPQLQRQALRLRFVEGLRCSEIATKLGKREGAVRTLLSRTLNVLRSAYM